MPIYALDDLTTPLSREEVSAKIYEIIAHVGTSTTSWKPGSPVRTMIAGASIVLSAFSTLTASLARMGFVELASGKWLELVAWYVYRVEKEQASFATGEVTLTNTGGGVFSLEPGDLILRNAETDKTYRNAETISLPALASATVPIIAIEMGSASTSAPDTITEFVTPLLGVTVTNQAAVVGLDAEDDITLQARCAEKLGSLSPFGPWDAYSYAARTAKRADGSSIGITRVRHTKDGYGNVRTYVATATGEVTGSIADPSSDLGTIHDAIQKRAAPLGVTATVQSAVPVAIPVSYRVSMYNTSGLTEAQIATAIKARLVAFMVGQPIGGNVIGATGKVFGDAIATAIGATRAEIFHVEVVAPSADVVLSADQVPVLGTVTAVGIVQVAPSEGASS